MKTKTQIKHSVVPAAPIAGATAGASFAVGMDLGYRRHSVCVLDAAGRVVHRDRIANGRPELRLLAQQWKGALFVMEVGVHSPWKADALHPFERQYGSNHGPRRRRMRPHGSPERLANPNNKSLPAPVRNG